MTYLEIPGWFDYAPLYDRAVRSLPAPPALAVVCEVGCWAGRSLAYLAGKVKTSGKRVNLWGIDHGFGTDSAKERPLHAGLLAECGGNTVGRLAFNLRACGLEGVAVPMAAKSVRAASLFPDRSVDFVFLDAAHDYDNVTADLKAWWPKIKPGGTLAGHDYSPPWPDVTRAVNEFFKRPVPDADCPHCWSVVAPG